MHLRLVISFVLMSVLPGSLLAASAVERDHHFWSLKSLIDKELQLVAEPELEAFKNASYPEGDKYALALRLLYCRVFQLDDPKLADEIPGLEKSVGSFSDERINKLVSSEVSATWILTFVNPILRDLLPTSPAKPLGDEKKARVQKRVKLLCEKARYALDELRKNIATNKEDEDKYDEGTLDEGKEMDVIRRGVELRLDYCNAFYYTFLALREVIYRGDEYGLDKSDAEAFMQDMLGSNETIEELGMWDWNYGEYQIFLRHRLVVMLGDVVRIGHKYGDYGQTLASFMDVLDTPLDSYPGRVRPYIQDLKITALTDVLNWHIALQKNRDKLVALDEQRQSGRNSRFRKKAERPDYAKEGIKIWKQYEENFELPDLLGRTKDNLSKKAAEAYFVAARLHRLSGDTPKALEVIGKVLEHRDHYYYGNARRWKAFLVKPPGDPDLREAPKVADPEQVLTSVADILAEARRTEDSKQRRKTYMSAATSLRNAVYSLQQPEYIKKWIVSGPSAYYQLSYTLYKLDLIEHSAIVAIEGAEAFGVLYERRRGNPFKDSNGKHNKYADDLKKLVQNMSVYAGQLRRVDSGEAGTALYKRNLEIQKVYPEDWTGTSPKAKIVNEIQEKNHEEALLQLDAFAEGDLEADDQLWEARIRAYVMYLLWDKEFKDSGADGAAELSQQVTAAIEAAEKVIKQYAADQELAEDVSKARKMVISVEVGKYFRTGEYLKVLTALDEDFWASPPEESSVLQKLANQMCVASYKYHIPLVTADARKRDPQKLIEVWPHIKRSYSVLQLAREHTGASLTNSSKALAEAYKNLGKLADWFIQNQDNLEVAFKFADMNKIAQQAPLQYGNLMMPVVEGDVSNLPLLLTVARTLHKGGDGERAALLYEQYIAAVDGDPQVKAYRDDPRDVVNGVGDVIRSSPSTQMKEAWPEIRDLLVDQPGFIAEYKEHGGTSRELSEEKIDYNKAADKLEELLALAERSKAALGSDYEQIVKALSTMQEIAESLAIYMQVLDYTVDAYLSVDQMDRALPYIKQLIQYDPIYPRYQALNIEIVLRQIEAGNPPPREEIINARLITAERMRLYDGRAGKLTDFWQSYCQAWELTAVLGEVERINKSLRRHHVAAVTPILFDLAHQDEQDDQLFTARDQESAGLIRRYLKLYDIKGVTFPKPFEISQDEDQVVIRMVKEQ